MYNIMTIPSIVYSVLFRLGLFIFPTLLFFIPFVQGEIICFCNTPACATTNYLCKANQKCYSILTIIPPHPRFEAREEAPLLAPGNQIQIQRSTEIHKYGCVDRAFERDHENMQDLHHETNHMHSYSFAYFCTLDFCNADKYVANSITQSAVPNLFHEDLLKTTAPARSLTAPESTTIDRPKHRTHNFGDKATSFKLSKNTLIRAIEQWLTTQKKRISHRHPQGHYNPDVTESDSNVKTAAAPSKTIEPFLVDHLSDDDGSPPSSIISETEPPKLTFKRRLINYYTTDADNEGPLDSTLEWGDSQSTSTRDIAFRYSVIIVPILGALFICYLVYIAYRVLTRDYDPFNWLNRQRSNRIAFFDPNPTGVIDNSKRPRKIVMGYLKSVLKNTVKLPFINRQTYNKVPTSSHINQNVHSPSIRGTSPICHV